MNSAIDRPTKQLLLVLHGWGHDQNYWREFKKAFAADNIRVIILELPGFGKELRVNDNWGVPEYAKWVKQRIETKKSNHVVLLGHSFGGRIGLELAARNPFWLKKLILYGSPVLYRPSTKVKAKIFVAKVAKIFGFSSSLSKSNDLREAEKNKLDKIFRKVVIYDQSRLLAKIKIPTLVVWGENDREVPLSIAKKLHSKIANSKLIVLEGVGHNAHLEAPHLFYGIIKNFIKNL